MAAAADFIVGLLAFAGPTVDHLSSAWRLAGHGSACSIPAMGIGMAIGIGAIVVVVVAIGSITDR